MKLAQRTPIQRITLLFFLALVVAASLQLISWPELESAGKVQVFEDFTGRVVRIIDGDTIDVLHDARAERIRLHGIDCPEKGQPFGSAAKQYTSELSFNKNVTVNMLDVDQYGRTIAEVTLPSGHSLNQELVKMGFAWWYRRHAPQDTQLAELEGDARKASRGLWADHNSIPPWEWRKHTQ